MGHHLHDKLVTRVNIRSDGNMFYELVRDRPHDTATICPDIIQSVDLISGRWGTVGSVVIWNCTIGGKQMHAKEIIEAVDTEKKSITYNVVEGEIMELYRMFKITVSVEDKSSSSEEDTSRSVVAWAVEFEKTSESVPEPKAVMDGGVSLIKGIDRYHLLQPN